METYTSVGHNQVSVWDMMARAVGHDGQGTWDAWDAMGGHFANSHQTASGH